MHTGRPDRSFLYILEEGLEPANRGKATEKAGSGGTRQSRGGGKWDSDWNGIRCGKMFRITLVH